MTIIIRELIMKRSISIQGIIIMIIACSLIFISSCDKSEPLNKTETKPKANPSMKFEHMVIRVNDLASAIDDYQKLGFTVIHGGNHSNGLSHNALIYFQDGSFIELFAFRPIRSTIVSLAYHTGLLNFIKNTDKHLKYRFAESISFSEGFIDAALFSDSIDQDIGLARWKGLETTPPIPLHRKRPDGIVVHWKIASPFSSMLPFVRDPYVPSVTRDKKEKIHQNGVVGIIDVQYAVENLQQAVEEYQKLLNQKPIFSSIDNKKAAVFPLGEATLTLLSVNGDPVLTKFIVTRRQGPYAVTLRTSKVDSRGELDQKLTHGAILNLQ